MNFGYIYKTTNLKTGKIYIGQRKGSFDLSYKGSGLILNKKIKEYGMDNFKVEVICFLPTKEQLDEFERHIIAKYREILGRQNLYNISDGGRGRNGFVTPLSTILKLAIGGLGRKHTPEARMKMSLNTKGKNLGKIPWNKGISHSKETKMKISMANKGKCGLKGRKFSQETIQKMREAKKNYIPWNKGKSCKIETKLKLSRIHKGKHYSPQTEFKKKGLK